MKLKRFVDGVNDGFYVKPNPEFSDWKCFLNLPKRLIDVLAARDFKEVKNVLKRVNSVFGSIRSDKKVVHTRIAVICNDIIRHWNSVLP